jgi:hypothetical protein
MDTGSASLGISLKNSFEWILSWSAPSGRLGINPCPPIDKPFLSRISFREFQRMVAIFENLWFDDLKDKSSNLSIIETRNECFIELSIPPAPNR